MMLLLVLLAALGGVVAQGLGGHGPHPGPHPGLSPAGGVGSASAALGRCEEITIPMCRGIGYNLTSMPNELNHDTQVRRAACCSAAMATPEGRFLT